MLETIKLRNVDVGESLGLLGGIGRIGNSFPAMMAGGPRAQTHGRHYFLNGEGGSDSYDGFSAEKPLATFEEAFTRMRARIDWSESPWANYDILWVYPGVYAENLTALPHGCAVIGVGGFDLKDGQMAARIVPASGAPVDVGAFVNAEIYNIAFESKTTYPAFDSEILNNVLFDNCYFSGPVETSTAAAGIVAKDSVMLRVVNCQFSCLDKGIDINYADGGDSFSHAKILNSIFDQIDTAGIEISSNLVGPSSLVRGCSFHGGGVTMGYAINDGSAILDVSWCDAESTSGFSGCRSVNASYNNGVLIT